MTLERRTFRSGDGVTLSYGMVGAAPSPVLLLCHGLGAGAEQFAADAHWAAGQGFRVLVPDLRGHGASGVPEGPGADFSLRRLAQDLLDLFDHEQVDQVHFVGNSLGGILGLSLAAQWPARFASLAIFGTALSLSLPGGTGAMLTALDRVPGRGIAARLTAISTTRNRQARPLIETLLRQYDGRAVAAIARYISRYDLRAAARAWAGPGLVLVGGRDRAVNRALLPQLAELRERPNWQIETLPEGGHCANLDAGPGWRTALLAFWRTALAAERL